LHTKGVIVQGCDESFVKDMQGLKLLVLTNVNNYTMQPYCEVFRIELFHCELYNFL